MGGCCDPVRTQFAPSVMRGVVHADVETPIEHFKALYRGDRLKLELQSRRDGARVTMVLA